MSGPSNGSRFGSHSKPSLFLYQTLSESMRKFGASIRPTSAAALFSFMCVREERKTLRKYASANARCF